MREYLQRKDVQIVAVCDVNEESAGYREWGVHKTWKEPDPHGDPGDIGGRELAAEGLLFVGDEGKILCDFAGDNPRLLPKSKMEAFEPPPQSHESSPANPGLPLDGFLRAAYNARSGDMLRTVG